jgi:signal transduction histidine kinase
MIGRLRSLWNAPAASPAPPKRVWRDWVLIAVIPLVAVFEALVRPDVPYRFAALVILILIVPTLLGRRSRPLLMLAIAFVLTTGFEFATSGEFGLYSAVFILLLVYSVFRWGSGRALLVGGAALIVTTLISTLRPPFVLSDLIGGFAISLVTALLGLLFRFRAGSRMRELDRAKASEREGLARDLHDTVAHHVSAIAVQAQAGLANPSGATAALETIEREASRTLSEMRAMVRVLREGDAADLTPAPGIADVPRLTDDVEVTGDVDRVPIAVSQAVYRIAQEAITNARRHARDASRIIVRVAVEGDAIRMTVHDDGAPAIAAEPGFGITGMTERAALLGGRVSAGPDSAGGWTVAAELPVRAS